MDVSIIKERMEQLETFKNENKIAREALKNELENDTDYLAVCEEIKALMDKKKRIKDAIWAKAETQKLISDIKENRDELGTLEEILSSELMEYFSDHKTNEIEDQKGEVRKFKVVAKLLPKKNKTDDESRDTDGKYAAQINPSITEIVEEADDEEIEDETEEDEEK
ncbi:MAG: hypothetical protein WCP93_00130 [Candidatus Berkelbacteria bacterium]